MVDVMKCSWGVPLGILRGIPQTVPRGIPRSSSPGVPLNILQDALKLLLKPFPRAFPKVILETFPEATKKQCGDEHIF